MKKLAQFRTRISRTGKPPKFKINKGIRFDKNPIIRSDMLPELFKGFLKFLSQHVDVK